MSLLKSILIAGGICAGFSGLAQAQDFGFASFSAVVKANGNLARGSGVQSSNRVGKGLYEVVFAREVNNCAYMAGPNGRDGGPVVVRGKGGAKKLRITTYSRDGVRASSAFTLIVSCGS